jgi:7-keto-8-aminopelargonate synthetase-like enzyme
MTAEHERAQAVKARFRAASAQVDSRLSGGGRRSPAEEMRSLADEAERLDQPGTWDRYGDSGPVAVLEDHVRELLGKPAAVMFPSGIMAQQSVLRVLCDEQGTRRVALPDLSHLLHHELDGPLLLQGLRYERLTTGATFPLARHLEAIPGKLGAVLTELPLRDAGYLLRRGKS